MTVWKKWKYKNLTYFFLSIYIAFYISNLEQFDYILHQIGNYSYISAFIAGMLFVSTFTIATGAVILLFLADVIPYWQLSLVAGLGAVVGDILIYKFVKDNLADELSLIYDQIDGKHHISKLLHSKYFSWTLPVLGALIIVSPFPDEIGVSLMGISKMSTKKFILIAFILDVIGVFLLVSAVEFIAF